ncbi:MAG: flippase-like domain-containing protein [Rhizobacter sp.]|nr:flippase-like domain-containing protein [Bacteriovorax sp.]
MTSRQKIIIHTFLISLSVALLIGLGLYVHKNQETFEKIKHIHIGIILMLISMHIINYCFLGLTHRYPLKKDNVFLKFNEWYGLCTVADLYNLLLPASGGTAIRFMYINKKKHIPMSVVLSMSLSVFLPGVLLLGVTGSLYTQFFMGPLSPVFNILKIFFIGLTVGTSIFIFGSRFLVKLFKLKKSFDIKKYFFDRKIFLNSLLCYVGMFLIHPVKVYLSFKAIGVDIPLSQSYEISLILLASAFFQVLPGNVGVKELVTAYISQQYGIQFETALLASLVDRAILLLFLFPFGAYFYWRLFLDASLLKRIPEST